MKRREFITLAGGFAGVLPLGAAALGQPVKAPTIGVLVLGNPNPEPFMKAFQEALAKIGYIEGQNVRMELRSAGGDAAALGNLAGELVRLKPDVIVAWQTPSAMAAKQATSSIPIIMAAVGDAVATGLVTNLSRPEANVTGNTAIAAEVMAKTVELIRETLPAARRVAVLANLLDPFSKPFLTQIELAAPALGIEISRIMMRPTDDATAHFEEINRSKIDAAIIQPTLIRKELVELALKHSVPSFSMVGSLPSSGGLISYGASAPDQWREVAMYVGRILKGAHPADLPVAQPTIFELIVNLKTARALGITIPSSVLARADEVIE